LRALGRLREALKPFKAAVEAHIDQKDEKRAAGELSNLSELQLVLGDGADALKSAENSVAYADKSGDAFQRMGKRTTLADALFHAGEADAAEAWLAEAETLQAQRQRRLPRPAPRRRPPAWRRTSRGRQTDMRASQIPSGAPTAPSAADGQPGRSASARVPRRRLARR